MVSRRALLATAVPAVGVGLAGCASLLEGGDAPACSTVEGEPTYGEWFDGVGTYRGTCDMRDRGDVSVVVGAHGGLGHYRFVPTAVAVAPDATVRWEWSGKGGPHNVVAESEVFDSGDPVDSDDAVFEYTFETPGLYRYYCRPHRQQGMRGAVYVTAE